MKFALFTPLLLAGLISATCTQAGTAIEEHGALAVSGNRIVDKHQQPVSFAGPSLFWSNTGWSADRYYNPDVINYIQEQWNAPIIRTAIGVDGNGSVISHREENYRKAETVVDAAIKQGMYIILDWHAHHAEKHRAEAIAFFEHFAKNYGEHPNIIYEIYNEPLANTDWNDVIKPYSESLVKSIRTIDPDNLIIVGTQSWSQDVDKAADNPITGYNNIAYTLHFYAGTHKASLREKAQYALNKGVALMVTEWGTVNANGDGGVNRDSTEQWLQFMRENQLSHANWALNDKAEGASMLKPGTPPDGNWSDDDLTESGLYVKSIIKNWHDIDYSGDED
ncbi:glycoside hydrolase family 5 protein [Gilvimarinus sp. SDUM040013]|uniref:Glycoside hydrolase family 5 protein n=1 Tax=Gilvimarinus gilvus TaxID=3058038 RepID=A0ABU4S1R8_9GAMM|nr:glycoside hydrolase family 5 protein [Gilvimarinus sp. SDUM040013]MDO3388094.1 glycoside hydrolase family 5 protein [Gilvimarinus sp. SDUM040013]MDX6850331.1 glycoside hydrolase family 5 protein [Gilvimarinus sp. SDUM040013]